jgi:hypothetical protein
MKADLQRQVNIAPIIYYDYNTIIDINDGHRYGQYYH